MFELKVHVLDITPGVSKKTGNTYHVALLRSDTGVFKCLLDSSFTAFESSKDKDVIGLFKLSIYNLEAKLSLTGVKK